jgi:hypothetical protein
MMVIAALSGGTSGFSIAQAQTPPPLDPLAQLLAPVALYPDALLAQVLTAATSPNQVKEANDWVQQNQQLHGTELQEAASQKGFDASFVALALFPDVLTMMATNIDWTTELGTAFLSDPKGVMASVQQLRAQAQAAGNLKTTPQQEVVTQNQEGQQVIVIQPANPQVVYVPVYNPQVVYYPAPPTAAVVIGFGVGIAIGAAIYSNAYYAPWGWGAWGMGWHSHSVVVVGRPWVVPPHARYPYVRPVPVHYGGVYRPRPYVYAPRNVTINNNINVNNGRGGVTPRPTPYAPRPATPPSSGRPGTPGTAPGRPSTLPATPPATRPGTMPARPATPGAGQLPANGSRPGNTQRPATGGNNNYGSRGYNPGGSGAQQPRTTSGERTQTKSSAYTGYQNGGSERAASARGKGSVGSSQSRPASAPKAPSRPAPSPRR